MDLLGAGAGASEGLDTFLNRLLIQQELDERGRHNVATEAATSRGLDQNEAVKKSLEDLRQSQIAGLKATQDEGVRQRQSRQDMLADPNIPDAVKIQLRGYDALPKGEKIDPTLIQPKPATEKSLQHYQADVDLEGPTGAPQKLKNVMVTFNPGDGSVALNGNKLDPKKVHGIVSPAAEAAGMSIVQSGDGYYLVNRGSGASKPVSDQAGAHLPLADTQVMRNLPFNVRRAEGSLDRLSEYIDEAEKRGLLGPLSGRAHEFMSGTVGTTGDKDDDYLLGQLRSAMRDIPPEIALAIGEGARGASSVQLLSRWDSLFNMNGPMTVRGAINETKKMLATPTKGPAKGAKPDMTDMYEQYLNLHKPRE